ncbi:unnamed protein product [Chondrus crispus]|uniref:Uncharacterized protein n=1 Tax=Chondrus crispus TaxID=2769 RepID=R7QIS2_CHOCR|nr:unnamed protein product [Chondrus crispus]CDF37320.1 unnamed protein product [Chondrus crispus]|eukprot:XP_005717139.1 unnamed protein product [Chondrus crispus]
MGQVRSSLASLKVMMDFLCLVHRRSYSTSDG